MPEKAARRRRRSENQWLEVVAVWRHYCRLQPMQVRRINDGEVIASSLAVLPWLPGCRCCCSCHPTCPSPRRTCLPSYPACQFDLRRRAGRWTCPYVRWSSAWPKNKELQASVGPTLLYRFYRLLGTVSPQSATRKPCLFYVAAELQFISDGCDNRFRIAAAVKSKSNLVINLVETIYLRVWKFVAKMIKPLQYPNCNKEKIGYLLNLNRLALGYVQWRAQCLQSATPISLG